MFCYKISTKKYNIWIFTAAFAIIKYYIFYLLYLGKTK